MTRSKQPTNQTETEKLSETELNQVSGGIIAVMPQKTRAMGDGSVQPAPVAEKTLIGLL